MAGWLLLILSAVVPGSMASPSPPPNGSGPSSPASEAMIVACHVANCIFAAVPSMAAPSWRTAGWHIDLHWTTERNMQKSHLELCLSLPPATLLHHHIGCPLVCHILPSTRPRSTPTAALAAAVVAAAAAVAAVAAAAAVIATSTATAAAAAAAAAAGTASVALRWLLGSGGRQDHCSLPNRGGGGRRSRSRAVAQWWHSHAH